MDEELLEAIAKAIDPLNFRSWGAMVEHCLASGDDEATARRYADSTYGPSIEKARETARAVLPFIQAETEAAWRDGFQSARGCLPDDAAKAKAVYAAIRSRTMGVDRP